MNKKTHFYKFLLAPFLFFAMILSAEGKIPNVSTMKGLFPILEWKCIPTKFNDHHTSKISKKDNLWDGECTSLKNPKQNPWRLTMSSGKWTRKIGEKISGEILFIEKTARPLNFSSFNKQENDLFYRTWGNEISSFLVGGFTSIKLKASKKMDAMNIYGIGLGIGLQSHKNLIVSFRHLPRH